MRSDSANLFCLKKFYRTAIIAILSGRIEEVVQQHWPDKDEDAAKSLYAQALNNLQSHRDELRRSLSKPINDLIDEGLIDPEPKTGGDEDEMED